MNALKLLKNWKFLAISGLLLVAIVVAVSLWRSLSTGLLVAGAVVAAFLIWVLAQILTGFLRARWASRKLESELANQPTYLPTGLQETTPGELKNKFKTAISTLKSSLGKGFLYELPWFVLMGEAGSGKTTSLRKSNIRWPLGGEQQGIGGTVNCDWWFANDAVILDTAGRFAVHDAGSPVIPVWDNFLKLLKRVRPRKPIDGVVVAIPADSLITTEENREAALEKARKTGTILHDKLSDLQRKLGVVFPVYILVTKCDKIRGFEEMFTLLPPDRQGTLFGWSNPHGLDQGYDPAWLNEAFERIGEDLHTIRGEILRDGETPENSDLIYLFPEEFRRFRTVLAAYLEKIFEFSRYEEPHRFRGFFFSSGGQDQNPLSSLIELEKREAARAPTPAPAMGTMMIEMQDDLFGRPYFVHDFYARKVFKESGLCRPSRKIEGTMGTVRQVSRIGAVALAVIGIGFFIWQFFSQSGAYNEIHDELVAVEDATSSRQDPDSLPFLDYKVISPRGETGNLIHETYALLEKLESKISAGVAEDVITRLDRLFLWELRRYIAAGNAAYARQALRPGGEVLAFTALPGAIDELLANRRRLRGFLDEEMKLHDLARTAVELYEPAVGAEASAGLKLFFQEPYLLHATSVGRDRSELGEALREFVEKVFSAEDLAIVTAVRQAYEDSTLSSAILHEVVEGEGHLFERYSELFDRASRFQRARRALDGTGGAAVEEETLARDVVNLARLADELQSTLKGINDGFQKVATSGKDEATSGEGAPKTSEKIEAVKSLVVSLLPRDITATSKGVIGFLVFEGFDPERGRLQKSFRDLISRTEMLSEWIIGDAGLEDWKVESKDLDALFQTLLIDARRELAALDVNVEANRLVLEIDPSTEKLLGRIRAFSPEVTDADNGELIRTPSGAVRDLKDLLDNPEAIDKLAKNSQSCQDLREKAYQIEFEEYQQLEGLLVNLDSVPAGDKALNGHLFEGALHLLFVHLWSRLQPLTTRENPTPNELSTGLRELLEGRAAWEAYLERLAGEGFPQARELLVKMESSATLEARKTLTDLMERYRPRRAFLPDEALGYVGDQRGAFLSEGSGFPFFKTLYPGAPGELDLKTMTRLREYLAAGKTAFRFVSQLVSSAEDAAITEYARVEKAFDEKGQKVVAAQETDYQQIQSFLSLLGETRLASDTHGAILAVRLDAIERTLQSLDPKAENFFTRQRVRLLQRAQREMRIFLAHELVSEATTFLGEFGELARGRFPFGGDATQSGVSVDDLLALARQNRARFLAGARQVTVEDRIYDFSALVDRAREALPPAPEGVPDFATRIQNLAATVCLEIQAFLEGDLGFSVFYRPELETESGADRPETRLDLFDLRFPGDVTFPLCEWGAPSRNLLWQNRRARNLITGKQGQKIEFNLGLDSEEVRTLSFDATKLEQEKSKALSFEVNPGDARCRSLSGQEIRHDNFKGSRLIASSRDGWYLVRFLRYFGSESWNRNVPQLGSSLRFELKGHLIQLPLIMSSQSGRQEFQLPVIVTFWKGENQDVPVEAPDFEKAFEQFNRAEAAAWKLESLRG